MYKVKIVLICYAIAVGFYLLGNIEVSAPFLAAALVIIALDKK